MDITQRTPTFSDISHRAATLHLNSGNDFVLTLNTKENFYPDTVIPDAILNAQHPGLSKTLRAYLSLETKAWDKTLSGGDVADNLSFLKGASFVFTDTIGATYAYREITSMLDTGAITIVHLGGPISKVSYSFANNEKTAFVERAQHRTHAVPKAQVDRRYPHWEERLQLGKELGLYGADLMTNVFTHEPLTIATLPDIAFD